MLVIWDGERLEQLRQAASGNLSSSQLAEDFHTTRNAIIGACKRNGISLNGGAGGRNHKAKCPPKSTQDRLRPKTKVFAANIYRGYKGESADYHPSTVKQRIRPHVPPDPNAKCGIFQLKSDTCHFPLWGGDVPKFSEQFYCGSPVIPESKAYCYCHHKMTTRTPYWLWANKPGAVGVLNGNNASGVISKV